MKVPTFFSAAAAISFSLFSFPSVASAPSAMPAAVSAEAEFNAVPSSWKWISDREVIFSYDGTYADSAAFVYNVADKSVKTGIKAPEKYSDFPVKPEGAINMTYSPDSTKIAYTKDNDLYVLEIADGRERRLTSDGGELILNGYASWVYYEEIFGRPTKYRAFWWSPDSRKIGFYRFDNTQVPLFPIYSPFGQDGRISRTRYPKAGETNPAVKIGIIDVSGPDTEIVWADFEENSDQYFGTPFWGPDSERFYVSRMPRSQQNLELFSVDASTGTKSMVYEDRSDTWVDWIDGAVFTGNGLYMARNNGSNGWAQIYFLSYDGKQVRQLTDGEFWRISILKVDERRGDVYFASVNESRVRNSVYRVDRKGRVTVLTDPSLDIASAVFSPDGRHFAAAVSNSSTPVRVAVYSSDGRTAESPYVVADMACDGFSPEDYALPQIIYMETEDGFSLPAAITYPEDFDPARKYPVHFDIYGGPDTPMVRDRWKTPDANTSWWSDHGIIEIVADCRASGHNGRKGLDMVYRRLTVYEMRDFIAWADYMKSLPYVDGTRIGVEGFSFGGTMAAMLVMRAPDSFPYGIAGGGVYDWALYDTHYTERYMGTPQDNPEGYAQARALNYVEEYPVSCEDEPAHAPVYLKLTHGTGDDNVHFQNSLQMIDALQQAGKGFELMIYPDGMHGYKGKQGEHFQAENRRFWLRYLSPQE